jgi:hypothetical protein
MVRDELVELLSWRLGDRDDMSERIIAEMQYTQEYQLEANIWLPWFLEVDSVGLTVTAGVPYMDLPVDFLREIEGHFPRVYVSGQSINLTKADLTTAEIWATGTGIPKYYSIMGNQMSLSPIPDQNYSIDWRYYGKSIPIHSTNEATPWLVHAGDLVLALVGQVVASKHLRDVKIAGEFANDAVFAWARLEGAQMERREVNLERAMGMRP